MAVTLADGPLGLEATHIWTPGDGGDPITLNDRAGLPRYWFDTIPGFKSLPEADDNRQPRTARIGESPLPSLARGKTFTPTGRIQARSLQELRQQQQQLQRAFGERSQEGAWAAIPKPAYGDDTHYWQTAGRMLQLDIDEDFQYDANAQPSPWQMAFTLGIRQSDPRWTWTDAQSAGPNVTQVTVTNQGSAPGELVVTIAGASGTVTVFNDTIGAQLKFTSLPAGTLVIDSAARSAKVGSTDVIPHLNGLLSNWWDRAVPGLQAGIANTIRQTGGDTIAVTFRHTSW